MSEHTITSEKELQERTPQDLCAELREALGLFAGAMPVSPRVAWEEAMAKVGDARVARNNMAAALQRALYGEPYTVAAFDVLAELRRQIEDEGWTAEHDDNEHGDSSLADAAVCYALVQSVEEKPRLGIWPWELSAWKPGDRRRNLVKAAALILAEIERLDRQHQGQEHDRP